METPTNHLDSLKDVYEEQFLFHDENHLMLGWYAERIIARMRQASTQRLLSLGIGHRVLPTTIIRELGSSLVNYSIVEGSRVIIDNLRRRLALPDYVSLIHSYFEQYETREQFDAIEMGFVLEHVDDPAVVLSRFKPLLRPGGSLFVAVPNARSLHRLVGHAAGLLDNVHRLSPEDLQLGHQRYFDFDSLAKLILDTGYKVLNAEGILLKPITTGQLKSLQLSPQIVRGFLTVGVDHPTICNAMLFEATV